MPFIFTVSFSSDTISDYSTCPLKTKRKTDNATNPNDIHSMIKDGLYFCFSLVTSDAIAPAKTIIGLQKAIKIAVSNIASWSFVVKPASAANIDPYA